MVRPLIWLFVIGTGFQGMLEGLGRGVTSDSWCRGSCPLVFSKALEDFSVIMNFVIFPVFFLSADGRPYSAS